MDRFLDVCTLTAGAYMIGAADIALKVLTIIMLYMSEAELNKPDTDVLWTQAEKTSFKEMITILKLIYACLILPTILLIIGAWKRIAWCILLWIIVASFMTIVTFLAKIPIPVAMVMCLLKFVGIVCMCQLYREIRQEPKPRAVV